MSKKILETLFDSRVRVKILKLLFRNSEGRFGIKEIAVRTQEDQLTVRKEVKKLLAVGLLKFKNNDQSGHVLNPNFEFFQELKNLILKSSPAEQSTVIEKLNKLGRVKLAVIAGIFMNKESDDPLTTDFLIVGDDIDRKKLRFFLKSLEADVGKEIRFAVMDKEEFKYRLAMFDRFIRVLLESPHEKLINKLGI